MQILMPDRMNFILIKKKFIEQKHLKSGLNILIYIKEESHKQILINIGFPLYFWELIIHSYLKIYRFLKQWFLVLID